MEKMKTYKKEYTRKSNGKSTTGIAVGYRTRSGIHFTIAAPSEYALNRIVQMLDMPVNDDRPIRKIRMTKLKHISGPGMRKFRKKGGDADG